MLRSYSQKAYERLKTAILSYKRRCGIYTCEMHLFGKSDADVDNNTRMNRFVKALGFIHVEDWSYFEVEKDDAYAWALEALISDDRGHPIIIEPDIAGELLSSFFRFFSQHARYFTNQCKDSDGRLSSSYAILRPIDDYVFSSGVVILDNEKIGILWIDEDD